jgi:hypothetical protein
LIMESAPGSESQTRPSALHIHLWLDHAKTLPRGSASSKRAASDQGGPGGCTWRSWVQRGQIHPRCCA